MLRRAALARVAWMATVWTAGCAGGSTTPAVRCAEACERDEMCVSPDSPFCASSCPERALALLPAFRDAYLACYADLDCDADSSECEDEAASLVPRRPIDQSFLAACQTKYTECEEGFEAAFCFQSHYYPE